VQALHTFTPIEQVKLTWGSEEGQVALVQAPANNFGPPRLLMNDQGTSIYLLDSPNRRIVVYNLEAAKFSAISIIHGEEAKDACVLDNGKHFYLLITDNVSQEETVTESANKMVLYDQTGKILRTYSFDEQRKFNPQATRCDAKRGLIFEATDGHAYRLDSDKPLTSIPQQGSYSFYIDRTSDAQGTLWLQNHDNDSSQEIFIEKPADTLETVEFIGVDKNNSVYLTVEGTLNPNTDTETVKRFLRKYDSNRQLVAEVELPYSFYTYMLQDVAVTPNGEVFQMIPLKEHLQIVKWVEGDGATTRSVKSDDLSSHLFSYLDSQAEDFLPSELEESEEEMVRSTTRSASLPLVSRETIMRRAEAYANYRYRANSSNVTPRRGEYLGGKTVITPMSTPGYFTGVPYKWGGFDTLESFQQGLNNGKKAGDRNTRGGGSSGAVGVDCSGFISQVWCLTSKRGTGSLPEVATRISFSDLRRGDIVNKYGRSGRAGHVRLFISRNTRGNLVFYEASSRDWQVDIHDYNIGTLSQQGYKAYRYKNVQNRGTADCGNDFSTNSSSSEYPSSSDDSDVTQSPTGLYIYGNTSLSEGQTGSYRSKIYYPDNTYQDITHQTKWEARGYEDKSRYSNFEGSRLYTKEVDKTRATYVVASYNQLTARTLVKIHNIRSRGFDTSRGPNEISDDLVNPTKPPLKVDIQYVYRGNRGKDEPKSLTSGSVLYSGDFYKIMFTPTEQAYIYIFQTDSSEKIYRLFPMESFNGVTVNNFNPTLPNQTYWVPAKEKSFVLDNQIGEETIYFIATREPQPQFEQNYAKFTTTPYGTEQLELAEVELLEDDVKTRNVAKLSTVTSSNQPFIWKEDEEQFTALKQQLELCEGCMNVLKFWHR
jgi:hypothetical protein